MKSSYRFWILALMLVLALVPLILACALSNKMDWQGLALNFGTEMLGAIVIYILFDRYVAGKEKQEAEKEAFKTKVNDLVKDFGSRDRSTAIAAVEELRRLELLFGGQLQDVNLEDADLRGADLSNANLQKAKLGSAKLQKANLMHAVLRWGELWGANLKSANMQYANLLRANLLEANLQEANLLRAGLQRANLRMANLRGTNLREAFLQGAELQDADLLGADLQGAKLERAELPDGTRWMQSTDMKRFTDSTHPNFWHSDYSSSLSLWLDD